MDPERITRGVISLTTGDSRRGSLGSIFRFLGLCVCLGVQRGLSRVLIKYSGNVRLQIHIYSSCQFSPHACFCSPYFIPNPIQPRYTSHTPQTFHLKHI